MVGLNNFCTNSTSSTFDLAAFLSGALQLKNDGQLINKLAIPSNTIINSSSTTSSNEGRKRRRGEVANPANTLDGLVARRAGDTLEPFKKRYLSEQEAIEGPDDELEAKRMQHDPDVSTRTCSACGYVGKWISEMIRHKRVHTNERPFKCRYCSRTSKWKADLIRHVAKTHGIRVVSKYSRSKAFEHSMTKLTNKDDDEKPKVLACEPNKEPERQKQLLPLTVDAGDSEANRPESLLRGKIPLSYRCSHCLFEQTGHSMLVHHLRTVHNKNPYECRCRAAFTSIGSALSHATTSQSCSSDDLVLNVIPTYGNKNHVVSTSPSDSLSPARSRSDCSPDSGVQVDIDDLEADRTSRTRQSTSAGDSDNETVRIGPLTSPSYAASTPTTTSAMPSVDVSTVLLALQLQIVPDYFAAMASLMNSSTYTPMLESTSVYKCSQCGARFQDITGFVVHARLHMTPTLPSLLSNSHIPASSFNLQEQRDELLDVEK